MRLKHLGGMVIAVNSFLAVATVGDAFAEQAAWIKAKPGRCIALHQGQVCYQKVSFTWRVPDEEKKESAAKGAKEYCLQQSGAEQPIMCWRGQEKQMLKMEFKQSASTRYELRARAGNRLLATTNVEVAWVYKSRKNNAGWRLF